MQPVDFTTLTAICAELQPLLLPARLEQVYQRDRWTVCLALRTLEGRQWLNLSWHRQAARLGIADAPPKAPDTFTFSQQLLHQVGGLALVEIAMISQWERVVALRFAQRPGDPIVGQIYLEIMGQYSNAILVNQDGLIVSAAYQVSERQSRLRAIQTGTSYELPPTLTADTPSLNETFGNWQEKLRLIPGKLAKTLTSLYRGLSSALVREMLASCAIDPAATTDELSADQWQRLFQAWQHWLVAIATHTFYPHPTATGYGVIDWHGQTTAAIPLQPLLQTYYTDRLAEQVLQELRHQLQQRLQYWLKRLRSKRQGFTTRLEDAAQMAQVKQQADLLMAHLHQWEPGMAAIDLIDFESQESVTIDLSPEKNAVQNAQALYKKHQKLKRSRGAITPLRDAVQAEIDYLEQIETAIDQLASDVPSDSPAADLIVLEAIRDELITAQYLAAPAHHRITPAAATAGKPHQFRSPSGHTILVGRNNRQNDQLTFRTATDYDLWFHTQQIPGSHVLLRVAPGSTASDADLQLTADLASYFSQARDSEQAPIVYTQPKHLYKPKGAKLGMVIYKHETVLWGKPQRGKAWATEIAKS